jgi:hypothetical protein
MALPSTIPTSFLPHGSAPQRFRSDFSGAFGFFGYGVLGVVFLLAVGVFIYGRILANEKAATDQQLLAEVTSIDPKTAEGFIRLRDRLAVSETMLNGHIAFSSFFSAIEKIMPATIRFSSIHLLLDATGGPKIEGAGTAKNFNALAAASEAFATDGRVKDAIFSNLKINKDNSVSFSLAATLDPAMTLFTP